MECPLLASAQTSSQEVPLPPFPGSLCHSLILPDPVIAEVQGAVETVLTPLVKMSKVYRLWACEAEGL